MASTNIIFRTYKELTTAEHWFWGTFKMENFWDLDTDWVVCSWRSGVQKNHFRNQRLFCRRKSKARTWMVPKHVDVFLLKQLPKFNSLPLKNDGWKMILSFWDWLLFRGELLNFRGVVFLSTIFKKSCLDFLKGENPINPLGWWSSFLQLPAPQLGSHRKISYKVGPPASYK